MFRNTRAIPSGTFVRTGTCGYRRSGSSFLSCRAMLRKSMRVPHRKIIPVARNEQPEHRSANTHAELRARRESAIALVGRVTRASNHTSAASRASSARRRWRTRRGNHFHTPGAHRSPRFQTLGYEVQIPDKRSTPRQTKRPAFIAGRCAFGTMTARQLLPLARATCREGPRPKLPVSRYGTPVQSRSSVTRTSAWLAPACTRAR